MSNIIKFKARTKTEFDIFLKPYPASHNLPDWYVDQNPFDSRPPFNDSSKKLRIRNGETNATFKRCRPLLDGMTSGYIVPLWGDVMVERNGNEPQIFWKMDYTIFELHGSPNDKIIPPPDYQNIVFKFNNCWIPQTPPGYSCLILPPLGHNDLPFRAIPAVVDTDKSQFELVFPVWPRKNLHGIVEKGTPMVQIIPFKRNDWKSVFEYYEDGEYAKLENKTFRSTLVNHYIKNSWSKKEYK